MIEIMANDKGWKPSKGVVRTLLSRLRRAGIRSDWKFAHALNSGDILFCDDDEKTSQITAEKERGKWVFCDFQGEPLWMGGKQGDD